MSTNKTSAIATIDSFLKARHELMRQSMPSGMKVTPERIQKIVVAAIANDAKLAECTPASIWTAVQKSIQLGLEPCSPLGHAYLVPFKNKGVAEATLIVGYKGLIALARRSGEIESVSVRVVREGDRFRVAYGHEEIIEHVPDLTASGKATHYYAIIRYRGGGTSFEVLTKAQVDAVRARSRAGDSEKSPWSTDYDAMALKTAVKRAMRTAPLTVDLADAIETDDATEIVDVTPHKQPSQKVPADSALPPAALAVTFDGTDDAAAELAAVGGPVEETPAPVAVETKPVAVHDHGEEIALIAERIDMMDDSSAYKIIADDLRAAHARKANPLPKEHYEALSKRLVAAKDDLKRAGK